MSLNDIMAVLGKQPPLDGRTIPEASRYLDLTTDIVSLASVWGCLLHRSAKEGKNIAGLPQSVANAVMAGAITPPLLVR